MYHTFDYNTPWFEFLSYVECCNSLGVLPSITKWVRYNNYYKQYGGLK